MSLPEAIEALNASINQLNTVLAQMDTVSIQQTSLFAGLFCGIAFVLASCMRW